MLLLQLNPPLPLQTVEGDKGWAYLALDYGPEWLTYFLFGRRQDGQLWWMSQASLRLQDNWSLGRDSPPSGSPAPQA